MSRLSDGGYVTPKGSKRNIVEDLGMTERWGISQLSPSGDAENSSPFGGTRRRAARHLVVGLLLIADFLIAGVAGADDPADPDSWSIDRHEPVAATEDATTDVIELILDDGSREADVGFGTTTASRFMWLNQFARAPSQAIDLQEISVLFPPGPGMAAGNEVQLAVYFDADGDPSSGAQLLTTFIDEIQAVDGTTFSVYPIDPPLRMTAPGDILIGVINFFVETGVSPPSRPAALDTTASQGRSWVALWIGDPPIDPDLPPDLFFDTIDFLEPGNWMIRGAATPVPIVDVPALGPAGLAVLVLLIAGAGGLLVRRRRG